MLCAAFFQWILRFYSTTGVVIIFIQPMGRICFPLREFISFLEKKTSRLHSPPPAGQVLLYHHWQCFINSNTWEWHQRGDLRFRCHGWVTSTPADALSRSWEWFFSAKVLVVFFGGVGKILSCFRKTYSVFMVQRTPANSPVEGKVVYGLKKIPGG